MDIEKFIAGNNSVICVKDFAGKVLFQNTQCLQLCGDMVKEGKACDKNCMLLYMRDQECPERDEGTQYFPCQLIENQYYDVYFLNSGENLTSILYPLKNRLSVDMEYFTQFEKLTQKEKDIVSLVLRKAANKEICHQLNIKKDTLKSHLKSIYQKLPEEAQGKLKLRNRS
jgi:hypothetical protein